MDRDELSATMIQELGAMFAQALGEVAPALARADLDGIESRLQAVGRQVLGQVVEQRRDKPARRDVMVDLPVPIAGVISDWQSSIGTAVRAVWPGIPHQLCHFHYLREATKPIAEADRHAKVALKKRLRAVRPLERALEGRDDADAEVTQGYCLAMRTAVIDDRQPPLAVAGLTLHDRLDAIAASINWIEVQGVGAHAGQTVGGTTQRALERRERPSGGAILLQVRCPAHLLGDALLLRLGVPLGGSLG